MILCLISRLNIDIYIYIFFVTITKGVNFSGIREWKHFWYVTNFIGINKFNIFVRLSIYIPMLIFDCLIRVLYFVSVGNMLFSYYLILFSSVIKLKQFFFFHLSCNKSIDDILFELNMINVVIIIRLTSMALLFL